MTFEEWYKDKDYAYNPHLAAQEAYKAGQESMRPLVEMMRDALGLIELATRYVEGDKALHVLATKAIAEADKFFGDK